LWKPRRIVPNIAGIALVASGCGIGLQQRHRHPHVIRHNCVEEIDGIDDLPHLLLEVAGPGPLPIAVPAIEVAGADACGGIGRNRRLRRLAGMAGRAIFGEDDLTLIDHVRRLVQIGGAAGHVLQLVRI
jgi:hypothetical protein